MLSRHISKIKVNPRLKNKGQSPLMIKDKKVIYFLLSISRRSMRVFLVAGWHPSRHWLIIFRHLYLMIKGPIEGDYLIKTWRTSTKMVMLKTSTFGLLVSPSFYMRFFSELISFMFLTSIFTTEKITCWTKLDRFLEQTKSTILFDSRF